MNAHTIEAFKNNFDINTDITDVNFRRLQVDPYTSLQRNHQFGEKISLLYHIELTVYNIDITLRVLIFKYENTTEVLKLEIKICNELLAKEIAPCKNFLQRKRNMDLTLGMLIKFTRLFEMRRLICLTVFDKQRHVEVSSDDTGMIVKCCKPDFTTKYLEMTWSIVWKHDDLEVSDCIEFYFNYLALCKDCAESVKKKLEFLVEPNIDFHAKLKLWKAVMCDLYGTTTITIQVQYPTMVAETSSDVLEILDSDSDGSVIEVGDNTVCEPSSDDVMVID